jgi:hypothetical protein
MVLPGEPFKWEVAKKRLTGFQITVGKLSALGASWSEYRRLKSLSTFLTFIVIGIGGRGGVGGGVSGLLTSLLPSHRRLPFTTFELGTCGEKDGKPANFSEVE